MTTGFSINSAGSGQAEEKAPAAERMTGSQAIIRTLELLGVTDVFGLPGGAILPTYDPLMDSSKINQGMRLKGMQLLPAKSACVLQHQGRAPQT